MQSSTFQDRKKRLIQSVEKRNVRTGDWCLFKSDEQDSDYLFGRILSLAVMDGKKTEGSKFVWEWSIEDKTQENVGALCVWYTLEESEGQFTGKLLESNVYSHGFFFCRNYLCSCAPPLFSTPGDVDSLFLTPKSVNQLNNFLSK